MKKLLVLSSLLFSGSLLASTTYYVNLALASNQYNSKKNAIDYVFAWSKLQDQSVNPSHIQIYTKNPTVELKKIIPTADPIQGSIAILSASTIVLSDNANGVGEVIDVQTKKTMLGKIKTITSNPQTKFKPVPVYEKMINEAFTEFIGNSNFTMKLSEVPYSAFNCEARNEDLMCERFAVYRYEITVE